jgi:hypothetical protein
MAYRFDEDFDGFLEDFGEPNNQEPIPDSVIEAYRHKLPEQLFVYWRALGACGFGDGLLWMTNPDEYQDLLDSWLEGTPFESRTDLSVIARTAFGSLFVWGSRKGEVFAIHPSAALVSHFPRDDSNSLSSEEEDKKMRYFWGFKSLQGVDDADASDKPLFARALKKLGPLKSDEMYGYKQRLSLGGKESLANLEIVKLHVYHDIAQQMEEPTLLDID